MLLHLIKMPALHMHEDVTNSSALAIFNGFIFSARGELQDKRMYN